MSDETVLTPITPEEGVSAPPKAIPSAMTAATSAPTVKLKPVIRKPLIRKPVIGGAKPVTLKPASGTPPPPAAIPEASVAETSAAPAAASVAKPNEPQLKSITSPVAAQAVLRKTGIVAEGILTPAQAQAAKTKTSCISLESAIGVAPPTKSAAPMKTIRLRRPTDIPPAPSAVKPVLSPLKPAAPESASAAPAAPASAAASVAAATPSVAPVAAPEAEMAHGGDDVPTAATIAAPAEPSATVTQKKTLKLRRPNFKRPTVGGLRKPGTEAPVAPATPVAPAPGADLGTVADIPDVADMPDIKPLSPVAMPPVADDSNTVAGVPSWLNVMTLVAGIAALIIIGLCTWSLFCQAVGPEAGPNSLASHYSETDRSR